ncbi:MAG TPA: aminoacetone oxidase family FAD-binding enzyme, partial [Acidobacteriaceae bacterium]|nr:aminoacetone oxidase family FAD-binding enzyme [Acidobacteriaceae bacterium]
MSRYAQVVRERVERLDFDAVVVGGGAAGLMAAIEAGRRGRRLAVVEHAERVGKKILISGGGRCNFTNIHCRAENFLSGNPHFAKSALARYGPEDFLALVRKHGIAYHEKTLGQLFCDGSAEQIVDLLLEECAAAGVTILLRTRVSTIVRNTGTSGSAFVLLADTEGRERELRAQALVVATGGLSIPKMGATGFGYEVARQFGVPVRECRPGLVPLVLGEADRAQWCDLTGLSVEVVAAAGKRRFREKLLVTHRGLSGPAVLQVSSYWREGEAVTVDWAPEREVLGALRKTGARRDAGAAQAALREVLPARLAERLVAIADSQSWTNAGLEALERRLHVWSFIPAGTEGYAKAEVTAGGVDTDALRAQTMECRAVPGLYFGGEAVDVTGWL